MSTPTISRTAQSSELSRNPANVFKAAEEGPVRITRRDGEPLVLLTSTEFDREHEGAELAAHLVTASLGDPQVPFVERLRGPFPWIAFLSEADEAAFAREIVAITRACASVGRFDKALVALRAWRSTAEAISAGYTPDDQLDWIEPTAVADPRTA
ncbi:type II toxin-antitoxin system Phd/YefM family antitoxin [Arthrobacter sp. 4R501]|uniref:type II toxin-antitoxin system Phd/YefM family antitoxin n=1 Tax=Arthrobacter sp. 4R501 TaxID=2058886 RepID=UPI000CE4E2FE|nr:type II toxin-antitoxin system Phd/YefM family antitoxin [Arthrobacter sp. 4R501]